LFDRAGFRSKLRYLTMTCFCLKKCLLISSAFIFGLVFSVPQSTFANVYATGVRLNNGSADVTVAPGTPLTINYVLNEAATRGVQIEFRSGESAVETLNLTPGEPGTLRGTNTITWEVSIPLGTYTVTITAVAVGYTNWTQITEDDNPGNHIWEGRGIAVNSNPSSPYYGRVYVSNSRANEDPTDLLGDRLGVLKWNADGSPASEGALSTGDYPWAGDFFSPWKVESGGDDRVYVSDFTANGVLLSWDPTISRQRLGSFCAPTITHMLIPNSVPSMLLVPALTHSFMWRTLTNSSAQVRGSCGTRSMPKASWTRTTRARSWLPQEATWTYTRMMWPSIVAGTSTPSKIALILASQALECSSSRPSTLPAAPGLRPNG
jgi:hypothetical protein